MDIHMFPCDSQNKVQIFPSPLLVSILKFVSLCNWSTEAERVAKQVAEEDVIVQKKEAVKNRIVGRFIFCTLLRLLLGWPDGILWSKDTRKDRKLNIYSALIKSSLLCGTETWRLTENNKRRVEVIEMDVLRRSSRISRK